MGESSVPDDGGGHRLDQSNSNTLSSGHGKVNQKSARNQMVNVVPGKKRLEKSRRGIVVVVVVVDITDVVVGVKGRNKATTASTPGHVVGVVDEAKAQSGCCCSRCKSVDFVVDDAAMAFSSSWRVKSEWIQWGCV